MPESFVLGTPDRHEEKDIDFAIPFMCKLRGTVQVTDPELLELELDTPQTTQTTQSSDRKTSDGLFRVRTSARDAGSWW